MEYKLTVSLNMGRDADPTDVEALVEKAIEAHIEDRCGTPIYHLDVQHVSRQSKVHKCLTILVRHLLDVEQDNPNTKCRDYLKVLEMMLPDLTPEQIADLIFEFYSKE